MKNNYFLKTLFFFFLGLLFLCVFSSNAQVPTATIEGRVLDDTGQVLPGAEVTAKNMETGLLRPTTTGSNGYYRIMALPPGKYSVTAALSGFRTEIKENMILFVGQGVVIDFKLKMSALEEEVTVSAQAPLVQTTKSEIGQVIETQRIEDLPLDGRQFLQLAQLAPGVSPSSGFGGGETSISAFSFRNVAFSIDGLDVTDVVTRGGFGFFSSEVVKEFQILTNRFSAEYGHSLSGNINVITKSGTNEWHGTVYNYVRDEALDRPRWIFDYDKMKFGKEEEKSKYSQQQFGFSIAGPIKKDRTHFFLNYEGSNYDSTAYVTADPSWSHPTIDISDEVGQFPVTYNAQQMFLKINHQINSRHYLQAEYSLNYGINKNLYIGGNSTVNFGCTAEFTEHLFLVSETFILTDKAVNELRFQFGQRQNDWFPNDRHPAIYQYTPYGVINTSGSHPSVDQLNKTRRIQIKDDLSLTFPGTKTGDHNFKFGFDSQFLQGDHDTRYTKNGFYVVWYGAPYYYRQAFGPSAFKFNIGVYGVYAQDDWRINKNLTLNLGVRYEYNTFSPKDKNNIAPRLGFAIDPIGDGRTVIRGGAGLYYDLVFTQLYQSAECFGKEGMFNITFNPPDPMFPANWGRIEQLPEGKPIPARDITPLDPDFKTAYSLQTSLGVSRQFGTDFAVSLDGVYIRGYNLLRIRDLNAPTEFHGPYTPGWEAYYGNFYRPQYPTDDGFRRIDQFESTGRSEYKALMVNLTKRMSHKYSFQISYTLAEAKDDLGYGGDYTSRPNDSTDMDADWGYSLNDLRHTISFNGLYYLPYGFSLGGIYMAYSGRPYTAQLGYDYNGDGVSNDRPPGVGKNTLRGDWFHKLDFFISKSFKISSFALTLRADAFNILNIRNMGDYGNIVGTLTYKVATWAYDPRTFQLAARVSF